MAIDFKLPQFSKEDLLKMCCVCKKIKINGKWIGEEHPDYLNKVNYFENTNGKGITHSICHPCSKKEMSKYE